MIAYQEVANLPDDHPKMLEFLDQEQMLDGIIIGGPLENEESLDYFNRYIAGDR